MRFDRTPYPQPHSLLCLNITAKVRLGSRARASRKAQGMRYGSGVSGRNCLYFRSGQGRRETNYCISLPWDFTFISLHLERVSGSLQKHTQVTKTTRKIQSKPASKTRMKRSRDQARLLEVGPAIDQGFPKAIQEGCPFLVGTGQTRCTRRGRHHHVGGKGPAGPVANFPSSRSRQGPSGLSCWLWPCTTCWCCWWELVAGSATPRLATKVPRSPQQLRAPSKANSGTKMEGAARFHPAPPPQRLHTKGQPLLPQTAPAP